MFIITKIDKLLNRVTMYRVILYYLIGLILSASILSYLGYLEYGPLHILFSAVFITFTCWVTNKIFEGVFRAPVNVESVYISALILVLIITPISSYDDWQFYSLAAWASVLAIASKFILAIRKKHVFNPAAFGVVVTAFALGQSASWWVGTSVMLPFVILGLLVVRKILRFDLVLSFLLVATLGIVTSRLGSLSPADILQRIYLNTPILYFAFIMLTEPLTTPPTRRLRILYGSLVGFLFVPSLHVGAIYSTPELALVLGNIFSYLISPKTKLILKLDKVDPLATDTFDFVFSSNQVLYFKPGQYLEWTLAHPHPDERGNRRYFTIASSPTEDEIKVGVKFNHPSSTFKKNLLEMKQGDTMVASQLAGDFLLPKNKKRKLVFLAGGIGVTPFRSMIKYLIDRREKRSIILLYSNRNVADFAYTYDFDEAERKIGLKTIYTLTDKKSIPKNWSGHIGHFNNKTILEHIPDYKERYFYLSGPHAMVLAFEEVLKELGIKKHKIKKDYFPGF